MLEIELKYFSEIQEDLILKYTEGFAVIKDNSLLGVFCDSNIATEKGFEKWGYVSMLVKEINENPSPPQKNKKPFVLNELNSFCFPTSEP